MTDHTDLLRRLRVLRATGPANSPTDRICRDAALVIEQLQTEIAAALRERDEAFKHGEDAFNDGYNLCAAERDALRVRAETAEADADRLTAALEWASGGCTIEGWTKIGRPALAAHAAAAEARPKPYVEEIMSDWANPTVFDDTDPI